MEFLKITQSAMLNPDKDNEIALTLCKIGHCHSNLQKYNEALTVLNRSLQIKQTTFNPDRDNDIDLMLHESGCCHNMLPNYNEAITVLNRSL